MPNKVESYLHYGFDLMLSGHTHGGQIINGAMEIGALTYADIRAHPGRNDEPWIWGMGYVDLNESDGVRYARRLEDRMSRWISVKLDFDPEFVNMQRSV